MNYFVTGRAAEIIFEVKRVTGNLRGVVYNLVFTEPIKRWQKITSFNCVFQIKYDKILLRGEFFE